MRTAKFLLIVSLIFVGVLGANLRAQAASIDSGVGAEVMAQTGYGTSNEFAISQYVGMIINGVLAMAGTVFLALTIYGGMLRLLAFGAEEAIEKSTKILKMAIIGIIITMSAYGISSFVISTFVDTSASTTRQTGGLLGGAMDRFGDITGMK